jgi:hypothetical protein
MSYTVKRRGEGGRLVAVYTCPEHGEFDAEVERDANGEAPDLTLCWCEARATWTPSPVACRVQRFSVSRGKWEKPERPTYLDTRKLGEGQSWAEFKEERKKVWEQKHKDDVMEFKRNG